MDNRFAPTLALLNASSLTAVSGSIRLYLAFLLAGIRPDWVTCLAAGFIIYATYTLDRALDSEEDLVNGRDYVNARRDIGFAVTIATFFLGAILFVSRNSWIAPVIPFIIGFFYSRGIRIGNHQFRLKGSLGGKNLVIGLTWGGTIALVIAPAAENVLTVFAIFLFFFTKLFINSTVYDMKDIDGDSKAGIRTLPVVLGDRKTKRVLTGMCASVHLIIALCMAGGILHPEVSILGISAVLSLAILLFYSSALEHSLSWIERNCRILLIDGEAPFIFLFRVFMVGQSGATCVGNM